MPLLGSKSNLHKLNPSLLGMGKQNSITPWEISGSGEPELHLSLRHFCEICREGTSGFVKVPWGQDVSGFCANDRVIWGGTSFAELLVPEPHPSLGGVYTALTEEEQVP